MDLIGLLKTGNPDYFFAPSGEYQTRQEVNEHQTGLVMVQANRGTLTRLESDAMIAEINNTTLDSVSDIDRPSTVFVSEMTTDFNKKFRNSFSDVVLQPFRMIPPIVWVLGIGGLVVYVVLMSGLWKRLIPAK